MTVVAIVDYGVGNVRSVQRALAAVGAEARLTADPAVLERADGVVLPGVGAFAPALARLEQNGLGACVVELGRRGKPLLGVCLGYQLLFEESLEHGRHRGLGLLTGTVREVTGSRRLPVIGWCRVGQLAGSPLWRGITDSSYFYFVHSFTPGATGDAVGSSEHSPAAAAARGNVMGTQFHPEKSGVDGLRVYENFIRQCA